MANKTVPIEAIRAGEQALLRVLRRRHPDVTWTIRPRRERDTRVPRETSRNDG